MHIFSGVHESAKLILGLSQYEGAPQRRWAAKRKNSITRHDCTAGWRYDIKKARCDWPRWQAN